MSAITQLLTKGQFADFGGKLPVPAVAASGDVDRRVFLFTPEDIDPAHVDLE